ncbi:hypothetical protein COO60DRAFT_341466 [Scenedesmus sp. NREL 46B-D3]|nr:hypothetical protein COO60DRAFT_341466 [Scenedesmus sp. NREL 46B-D3]
MLPHQCLSLGSLHWACPIPAQSTIMVCLPCRLTWFVGHAIQCNAVLSNDTSRVCCLIMLCSGAGSAGGDMTMWLSKLQLLIHCRSAGLTSYLHVACTAGCATCATSLSSPAAAGGLASASAGTKSITMSLLLLLLLLALLAALLNSSVTTNGINASGSNTCCCCCCSSSRRASFCV